MGTLIDDLLSFSEVNLATATSEDVNLNEIIDLVLKDLDLEIETKSANISVGKLGTTRGHHRQLQQAFLNLIGNALKYSKPDVPPHISIECSQATGKEIQQQAPNASAATAYHICVIRDNGIGFEQKEAERIFNVFTRLHGNSEYKGTGIGLSIVHKVIENHHGFITAESSPGAGATFIIYLPAPDMQYANQGN